MVDSLAFGAAGVHTHVFQNTDDLFNEVFWARIYAGFHYYHSLVDGGKLGERVSRHVVRKQFRELNGDSTKITTETGTVPTVVGSAYTPPCELIATRQGFNATFGLIK